MKVNYPLKDITDENIETKLGSNNKYGKYPIGEANIWHGGIHLEGNPKEVQAIADGRVIAYRLAKQEKEISIDSEIDKEQKHNYSNSFVLMQHDYESPGSNDKKGLKMTFYSIYHHLLSKTGIEEAGLKLPKFITKTALKVTDKQEEVKGLNVRSKEKFITIKFVLPKGAIVTLDNIDAPDNHWTNGKGYKKYKYKQVSYLDLLGTTHIDLYIATADNRVKDIENNQLEINTLENTGVPAEKGGQLKDAPNKTATILSIVKKDTTVTNLEKKGNYTKIKYTQTNGIEQEGYIYTKSLKEKETFDDAILDQIQASDLKIKAGQPIGNIGKYGVEGNPNYTATHLEVFTTKNITAFLENKQQDGQNKQHFATVPKDTKLKTNLKVTVDIKENTPIKILKFENEYAQVKITSITAILYRDRDINDSVNGKYSIKDLETVNKAFNGLVTQTTTFKESQVKKADTSKGWDEDLSRKITFYPDDHNKKYWIEKSDVAQLEIGECNEEDEEVITYQEAIVNSTTKTEKAITTAYIEPPIQNCDTETGEAVEEETVNKEHITDLRTFKKVKDNNDKTWYKSELTYKIADKKETKKGWLAEEDIELFSAYDWEKFGFKHLNAGSEFVYSLKDQKVESITATLPEDKISPFIKTVWDIIDTDGDKKLSNLEIKLAYDEPEKVEILSKLVCTHKNEWSYDIEKIKSEVQEIHNTSMGNNPSDKLIKQVKSRILALETKMKELMFWQETKNLAYTGEVDDKLPPRMFPEKDNVHYFHPLSWVRQMKLILGTGVPPWMEIALEEAKLAKGIHEDFKPTITMVKKYHNHCNIFDDPTTTKVEDEDLSWCSSYVSWCLDQTDYKGVKQAGSRFYIADDPEWNGTGKPSKNHKYKAKDMLVKVSEPLYGSLAVFSNCSKKGILLGSGGHIGFVFGAVEGSNSLAILGGNQGSKIKVSPFDCSGNVFVSWKERNKAGKVIKIHYKKLRGFYIPKDYKGGVPLDESNHYKSFKEANLKATTIKIKTKKDGEST